MYLTQSICRIYDYTRNSGYEISTTTLIFQCSLWLCETSPMTTICSKFNFHIKLWSHFEIILFLFLSCANNRLVLLFWFNLVGLSDVRNETFHSPYSLHSRLHRHVSLKFLLCFLLVLFEIFLESLRSTLCGSFNTTLNRVQFADFYRVQDIIMARIGFPFRTNSQSSHQTNVPLSKSTQWWCEVP